MNGINNSFIQFDIHQSIRKALLENDSWKQQPNHYFIIACMIEESSIYEQIIKDYEIDQNTLEKALVAATVNCKYDTVLFLLSSERISIKPDIYLSHTHLNSQEIIISLSKNNDPRLIHYFLYEQKYLVSEEMLHYLQDTNDNLYQAIKKRDLYMDIEHSTKNKYLDNNNIRNKI